MEGEPAAQFQFSSDKADGNHFIFKVKTAFLQSFFFFLNVIPFSPTDNTEAL